MPLPPPLTQSALWNGPAGHAWVAAQAELDRMFQPMQDLLTDAAAQAGARRVLDIGCGTGATTLAVARRLGAQTRCTGIDISAPMIALARERAAREALPTHFLCADAQSHAFDEPGRFDLLISRFGVMFFDDPVRAATHLRQASNRGASLCWIVWRTAEDNPFMTLAERTAAPLLPGFQPRKMDGPGQFAFSDPAHVEDILSQGSWTDIGLQALDIPQSMPERALLPYLTRLGPVGVALQQEADEQRRARVTDTVRAAFDPFVHGDEVRFNAACWLVRARAG